jgi:hypothetical protein
MAQREAAGLYGISWLLFHWFFNRHPEELVKYIETLQAGTPPEDAFRVALPKIDLGTVDKEIYEYQRHGQFEEIPRPLVRSATSESTLQDRPLDSSEIAQVKQALAEASKRNQVPPHGERSESSDTEGEGHSEAKAPPRPHVDYGKLPLLPQYPCDEQSKEKMPGQPAAEAVASPGADTRQAMRAGARPAKKTSEEAKAVPKAGKLAPEIVQRVIRAAYGRMRACYEDGLKRSPNLGGRVTVRFVIDTDGSVRDAAPICTSLADPAAVGCVVERYGQLKFPKPSGDGIVTVVYPIMFTPGD